MRKDFCWSVAVFLVENTVFRFVLHRSEAKRPKPTESFNQIMNRNLFKRFLMFTEDKQLILASDTCMDEKADRSFDTDGEPSQARN